MPVRRNTEAVGHFDADSKVAARSRRVAFQHGESGVLADIVHRAAAKAASQERKPADLQIPAWHSGNATNPDELVVVSHNWDEIRREAVKQFESRKARKTA
jgi:hypothetical protein